MSLEKRRLSIPWIADARQVQRDELHRDVRESNGNDRTEINLPVEDEFARGSQAVVPIRRALPDRLRIHRLHHVGSIERESRCGRAVVEAEDDSARNACCSRTVCEHLSLWCGYWRVLRRVDAGIDSIDRRLRVGRGRPVDGRRRSSRAAKVEEHGQQEEARGEEETSQDRPLPSSAHLWR